MTVVETGVARRRATRLTPRELDVARCIAMGSTSREIGRTLGISPHTVRRHTERVFEKLSVHTRAGVCAALIGAVRLAALDDVDGRWPTRTVQVGGHGVRRTR